MLNPYDHPDADRLAASAKEALPAIERLIDRAQGEVPVIYVNDNYGDWSSSPERIAKRALEGRHPELVEPILPGDDAWFVLKPRHTIFYTTPLEYLLERNRIDRVVLTGQVTEQCILYSALDAYVRHFQCTVPSDAVAHIHEHLARAALEMMEANMHADIVPADECRFERGHALAGRR
jgi:nicotinamidase-related amidase